jgi:vacuolar protein sorting-associated protein 29
VPFSLQVVPWGDLDSLAMLSRQMDVDGAPMRRRRDKHATRKPYSSCAQPLTRRRRVRAVLITGHTHEFKAYKYEDRLFINPVRYAKRHTRANDENAC